MYSVLSILVIESIINYFLSILFHSLNIYFLHLIRYILYISIHCFSMTSACWPRISIMLCLLVCCDGFLWISIIPVLLQMFIDYFIFIVKQKKNLSLHLSYHSISTDWCRSNKFPQNFQHNHILFLLKLCEYLSCSSLLSTQYPQKLFFKNCSRQI